MWRAIDLAYRAESREVAPNPRVGAVLVSGGRVIGEGYHHRVGGRHAEVCCLESVATEDRGLIPGSTLYVTLEPCAHQGRTPSCARQLVAEQVGKVVIGTLDPNPLVAGKGVQILQEAGIATEVGCLRQACEELAKVFLTNQRYHRPYILLKWAESADGYLDAIRTSPDTSPAALSTPYTQLLMHRLRSSYAAILVGRRTLELDRPSLSNRLWIPSPYSPTRLLLSRRGDAPEGWTLLREVSPQALSELYEVFGITSLMVEGGADVLGAFLETDLWDEARVESAPALLEAGVPAPLLPESAHRTSECTYGRNTITTYRP